MKTLKQLLIGGIVGFVGAIGVLYGSEIDYLLFADPFIVGLYLIILILWVWSFILYRQMKKINAGDFTGDDEDRVEALKDKKFADYSLFVQSSTIISLLALCMALITTMNVTFIIIGIVASVVSYALTVLMINLMRVLYPERKIPSISDPKYAEKLLESADEGEKFVILNGMYKSFNLFNTVLIFAIVGSTLYSIGSENSQAFSIIIMSVVLLIANGKYLFSVRNK